MNTPVSFEIAKLLKEEGFDKPTQNAYINSILFANFVESDLERTYYFDADDFYENWNQPGWVFTKNGLGCFGCILDNLKYFHAYSAPTIAEAVLWLYEKRGVWISVSISRYGRFYCNILRKEDTRSLDNPIGWEMRAQLNEFNSPKEAYEGAITFYLAARK